MAKMKAIFIKKLVLTFSLLTLIALPAFAAEAPTAAPAKEPIRIGEIYCYTGCAEQAVYWKNGWKLAQDEINEAGGVLGRPLDIISRDDKSDPAQVIKVLEDFKNREKIDIVFGTILSHITLTTSNFAKQNSMLFVRGFDGSTTLTGPAGHDLYFQVGAPRIVEVKYFAELAAKTDKKRWTFVAADYEAGRYYVDEFKKQLSSLKPDVDYIDTLWFPNGKLDAGTVTQAAARNKPDALFFVAPCGDYARFVREGNKRHIFDNRLVIAPWAGMAPCTTPMGKETPVGWVTSQAYPAHQITNPLQRKFIESYTSRYGVPPDTDSYYAYATLHLLAQAIRITGSTDPKAVAQTMHNTPLDTAVGQIAFRADGVSNQGIWIGKTGFYDGKPTVLNAEYVQPDKYLPSVEDNLKSRIK